MTALDSRAPAARSDPSTPDPPAIASERLRALRIGRRSVGWLAIVLPPVLVGYALFDKGFAYIHVPGTPFFAGELVVLVSVAGAIVGTSYMHRGVEHSTAAKLILLFAAWGLVRTVPNLGADGFDAVRDAALWYYALIAIPVSALVLSDRDLLRRWARGYRRLIPWLFVYSPLGLFLAQASDRGLGPLVPNSAISIWAHKGANVSVQVTIALAFLWLVPGAGGRFRLLLTGLATIVLLIGATQGRGGFVAAAAGLALVWLFARVRARMTLVMISTILLLVVIGWGLNIHIPGEQGRSISIDQLAQNVGSVVGADDSQAPGNLQANVKFRDQLWGAVIEKVKTDKKVLTGLGFGFDIARSVGFQGQGAVKLRSPHNSHLDVYARMGAIGLAIWIALWGTWLSVALRARSKFRAVGRRFEMSLVEVCVVGVITILINAYFDPTLESPQVAIWLWTLVGVTLGLVAVARRSSFDVHPSLAPGAERDVVR